MQVKKFEAPTIQEALDTIKRELGPEAIILQTKKHKRGFGLMSKASVEVTAAVSERSTQKKEFTEKRLPDTNREAIKRLPAEKQAQIFDKMIDRQQQRTTRGAGATATRSITATRYVDISEEDAKSSASRRVTVTPPRPVAKVPVIAVDDKKVQSAIEALNTSPRSDSDHDATRSSSMTVEEEVRHLKRMIEELKINQDEGATGSGAQLLIPQGVLSTPALQDAFEQMVVSGIDKRYALNLTKKTAFELGEEESKNPDSVMDQLASEVMNTTEVLSAFAGIRPGWRNSPIVIALVGPTGVGKTTTVAKMASEAILKRNLKVGLINLDSYKVAAFDQLGTYAKILNVPFRSVATVEDLNAAIQDFQSLDVVLVDTTGRSQRDLNSLKEMQDLLQTIPDLRTQLVLSVTTRDNELYDMANRFSAFHPQGIIISKLDEATMYGAVYNVSQRSKLPLLYFTTGQRVPEDIEEATRERVAALILDL